MRHFSRVHLYIGLAAVCAAGYTLWVLLTAHTAPWSDAGTFSLVVQGAAGAATTTPFSIGIDDVMLIRADGGRERVSVLSHRTELDASAPAQLVLDTSVPATSYSGIQFTLAEPDVRNEANDAPLQVALLHDTVTLQLPFSIRTSETTAILLSFETTTSVHQEAEGLVYVPTIRAEAREHASIHTKDGATEVAGGSIASNGTFGMDWSGQVRYNYRAGAREDLEQTNETHDEAPENSVQEEAREETSTTTGAVEEPLEATTSAEEDLR